MAVCTPTSTTMPRMSNITSSIAAKESVSRVRMESDTLKRRAAAHLIPEAAHGVDQPDRLSIIDLSPQRADVNVQRVIFHRSPGAPDAAEQHVAQNHGAYVSHQDFKQRELSGA